MSGIPNVGRAGRLPAALDLACARRPSSTPDVGRSEGDLHDEATDALVASEYRSGGPAAPLLRELLVDRRGLDRGNPDPNTLWRDFSRLDLDLWGTLGERDVRTAGRRAKLELLIDTRNAIAHSDARRFERLHDAGVRIDLRTVVGWRTAVDALADTMDRCVRRHLRTLTGTPKLREVGRETRAESE